MVLPIELARTQVGNERSLFQAVSDTGTDVACIVQSGSGGFRFVIEKVERVPATDTLQSYEYWSEAERSGIYETVVEAMKAAESVLAWTPEWRVYGSTVDG